jgi:Type I restriction-modification system methyltransferase subunit
MFECYHSYAKEFSKALNSVHNGSRNIRDAFGEFLEITSMSFQQALQFDEVREKEIIAIQNKAEYKEGYAEALAILVEALTERAGDFLGEWCGRERVLNANKGQFFTPYHISQLMAKLLVGSITPKENDPMGVSEPTCGSGGMVIAAFEVFKEEGFNPNQIYFVAQDIDLRCVMMAYIQFVLLDIPAVVKCGNSLTNEVHKIYITFSMMRNYPFGIPSKRQGENIEMPIKIEKGQMEFGL